MSNGDTAAEILEFVENEGADMPSSVTNKMIAMVLREQHQNNKMQFSQFHKRIDDGFVRIEKKIADTLDEIKTNAKRIEDIDKARIAALAEQEARKKLEKEASDAADKRFGRVGMLLTFLNDNALVTILLTGLGTYIVALLMGG